MPGTVFAARGANPCEFLYKSLEMLAAGSSAFVDVAIVAAAFGGPVLAGLIYVVGFRLARKHDEREASRRSSPS